MQNSVGPERHSADFGESCYFGACFLGPDSAACSDGWALKPADSDLEQSTFEAAAAVALVVAAAVVEDLQLVAEGSFPSAVLQRTVEVDFQSVAERFGLASSGYSDEELCLEDAIRQQCSNPCCC